MADARRKEERERILQLAGLVCQMLAGTKITKHSAARFIRYGSNPDIATLQEDDSPEVAAKAAEIERLGKLIVE